MSGAERYRIREASGRALRYEVVNMFSQAVPARFASRVDAESYIAEVRDRQFVLITSFDGAFDDSECGSWTGFKRHVAKGVVPCRPCREARNAKQAATRLRRAVRMADQATESG